ncbi:MAG: class I SAM-dependent methyltransferase [Phycisphaerales bacterium]
MSARPHANVNVWIPPDATESEMSRGRSLAEDLQLPIMQEWQSERVLALRYHEENRLAVHRFLDRNRAGYSVEPHILKRAHGRYSADQSHPLGRAIGKDAVHVLDATAGFGQDAIHLAASGLRVTALERCPIVHALLNNCIERIHADGRLRAAIEPHDRLQLIRADAASFLQSPREMLFDVIYLDPMFPSKRRKSALPPLAAQILRTLAGDDEDALQLAELAITKAKQRIVIKRPDHAPPLVPAPAFSFASKLVRYDVYLPQTARIQIRTEPHIE